MNSNGRARQFRITISVALSVAPAWMRRGITDKSPEKALFAKEQLVDHIAEHIERSFRVTWPGSDDDDPDAPKPPKVHGPLFGGP